MIKITKSELAEKIVYYVQTLGLKNDEIAVRLNEEFNADEKEALTGLNVAALKKQLGIKGIKPKKKSLFEFVEDETMYIQGDKEIMESIENGLKDVAGGNLSHLNTNKSVFDQI